MNIITFRYSRFQVLYYDETLLTNKADDTTETYIDLLNITKYALIKIL